MPPTLVAVEYLELNSVPFNVKGACLIPDMTPMKESPDLRGDDELIPGSSGVLARQRRVTATRKTFIVHLFGDNDFTGAAHANSRDGLQDNIDYLWANVVEPPGTAAGTRTAIWHLPDGSTTRTGAVHVLGLQGMTRKSPDHLIARLDISIPAGRLT